MDFSTFSAALEALENGKELLEFHTSQILTEKNKGIDNFRRSQDDLKKAKKFKAILKDNLGWDGESDVDEFIESVKSTLEGKSSQNNTEFVDMKKQFSKLQREFTKSQEELNAEREQRSELQRQNKVKTIESTLVPKLTNEFYGAGLMVKALLADGAVDIDESGEVIFKQGDKVMGISEGLKWLGDTYSDARKNKQSPGSGSQPTPPGQKSRVAKYTVEQLNTMTPEQAAADIVNYNESLKVHSGS